MTVKFDQALQSITENSYQFRIYKKTKEFYRVEKRNGSDWVEVEENIQIGRLKLINCRFIVDEPGRESTVNGTFKSSEDVPVHAWIEASAYEINPEKTSPKDGILYYNPFTVRLFCDRASYEKGQPKALDRAEIVYINGNLLHYYGGKFSNEPSENIILPKNEKTIFSDLTLIYSPLDLDVVNESYDCNANIFSPLTK